MKQYYLSTLQIKAILGILSDSYYCHLLELLSEEVILRKVASYLA